MRWSCCVYPVHPPTAWLWLRSQNTVELLEQDDVFDAHCKIKLYSCFYGSLCVLNDVWVALDVADTYIFLFILNQMQDLNVKCINKACLHFFFSGHLDQTHPRINERRFLSLTRLQSLMFHLMHLYFIAVF